jgi:hypothetical protein
MGRFQNHGRRHAGVKGFLPTASAQAPAVSRLKARKSHFLARRDKIIAARDRKFQKLGGHDGADGMKTEISWSRATEAIAIETRRRIGATALQVSSKNIRWHEFIVSEIRRRGS